jgi:sulfur carrier protein
MVVIVNGERRELPPGSTLQSVVELLGSERGGRGIAVAVSGEVVPRGAWASTALAEGAQVEVVAAVQGG